MLDALMIRGRPPYALVVLMPATAGLPTEDPREVQLEFASLFPASSVFSQTAINRNG